VQAALFLVLHLDLDKALHRKGRNAASGTEPKFVVFHERRDRSMPHRTDAIVACHEEQPGCDCLLRGATKETTTHLRQAVPSQG
jgi:hypothetical protein